MTYTDNVVTLMLVTWLSISLSVLIAYSLSVIIDLACSLEGLAEVDLSLCTEARGVV